MPRRRERPLPRLDISLEALPPPESKRTCRLNLSFTEAELAMIEKAASERGDQPGVLCRTIYFDRVPEFSRKGSGRETRPPRR
jgi:hypothetical protein